MPYILTDGSTTVVTYPYSIGLLRRDNPNVSFPANPTAETLADWNVFEVQSTAQPTFDIYTQTVSEGTPATSDGGATWTQVWDVIDLDADQQALKLSEFEESAAIESGSLLDQADQYVVTALVRGKALSEEFAAYRQALVDYQSLPGYPAATEWPPLPTEIIVDSGVSPISYPLAGAIYNSGGVTFNSESHLEVTEIVVPTAAANDYDITTALDELKASEAEAVLEFINVGDTSKKAAFKVKDITKTAAGTYEFTYRGFKAVYARIWGTDPNITNIIFYPETVTTEVLTPIDNDTDTEEFGLTNLSNGGTYAIMNIYGSSGAAALPLSELTNAAMAFVDNVIYTGSAIATASEAQTNFYAAYPTLAATVASGLYGNLQDVNLSDNYISDGGSDQYDSGNYINTNYESSINYGGGSVTTDSTAFGVGSSYVSMYAESIFAMFVSNSDITELGITGERGADGSGEEEHGRLAISYTPPTQEQIDNAPYTLTVSYLEGSDNFNLSGAQIVNLNYGRVSKDNEKIWNSPNNTVWKIVEVHGAKRVSYQPSVMLSDNSYSYIMSNAPVASSTNTQTQTTETDTQFVTVPLDVLPWLQQQSTITDQEIVVNGVTAVMQGGYSYGPDGPIYIQINSTISYTAGDSVIINGVAYQQASGVQIPDDGSILFSTIVPQKSQINYNGNTRTVTGLSQGDFGFGQVFFIYFDGEPLTFAPNGSLNLSLWSAETANKWIDPEVDFGISPNELRGFSLDYHLYSEDTGTMVGKFITAIDDNPRVSHMYAASGGSDVSAIDLETYSSTWDADKAFVFKRTDGEADIIMIQWSGKAFYSPEWYD